MSKTPTTHTDPASYNFSPKEIATPNKDFPGISKTVFTHVSNLKGLLDDWVRVRDKGIRLCKAISVLKLHECNDNYFPQQLKPLMESIYEALVSLKNIVDGVEVIERQLQALSLLKPEDQPVILTWSASKISAVVSRILQSLKMEFRLKQVITENVAHCRDENLIEVYLTSWELEAYFDADMNAYLFAEVGLT